MAHQIIKQPNGKYCIFSSIVDSIILINMTESEIIEDRVQRERVKIEKEVRETISMLNSGKKPYRQFTMSFSGAMKTIEQIHGKEEMKNIRSQTENK